MARIPEYGSRRDSDRSASSNPTGSSGWAARSGTVSGDSQRRSQESTDLPTATLGNKSDLQGQVADAAEVLPPLPPSSAGLVGLTPPCAAHTCIMQSWCKLMGLHRHPRSESAPPQPGPGMLQLCSPSRCRDGSRGWDWKGRLPFLCADLGCPGRLVLQWACCRNQEAWENSHKTGIHS